MAATARQAFGRAQAHGWRHQELTQFYQAEAHWLEDWAFYAVAKELAQGRPFWQWPEELAMRRPEALQRLAEQHRQAVELVKFEQFLLQWQWERLRRLLSPLQIIGDLPFYVALDSADVWAHPELFLLGPDLKPTAVAGVPPDYFSPDGQLWGNPVYCWECHQESGFSWWRQRIARALQLYDVVRLDHFRGFAATWQVPANAPTARHGQWVPTPGRELLHALGPRRPFLAEDLGHITPDVVALREELGLPGMAILQFAFNPNERSAFLPHRHRPNLVVYTGTHDNNTTLGWWEEEASPEVREFFRAYVGSDQAVHRAMVRLAMASVANLAIVPAQDVLGLPSSYRCNRPGTASGNWRFRLLGSHFYSPDWDWVGELARVYERWRFAETASGPR
ncbi:MAG: 4-alpha-glucanotransferase [Thermoanaerobaculum sp.]|nr:4-alpha-glucanotransferase [Thermoanaerobaculum sp.]